MGCVGWARSIVFNSPAVLLSFISWYALVRFQIDSNTTGSKKKIGLRYLLLLVIASASFNKMWTSLTQQTTHITYANNYYCYYYHHVVIDVQRSYVIGLKFSTQKTARLKKNSCEPKKCKAHFHRSEQLVTRHKFLIRLHYFFPPASIT